MDLQDRARIHAALGDRYRLRIVDELLLSDRSFQELSRLVGLPANAAAHHLAVLESAGLIERHASEGDHRRRYVSLRLDRFEGLVASPAFRPSTILFVCTHNSARSQFAAALWTQRTGAPAESAGTDPAERVHPKAISAARAFGVDLHEAVPKGYDRLAVAPELVVSVCDRAREAGLPFDAPSIHWSVPDPVRAGTADAFRSAFADLAARVERLAAATH
jgi:ArsR family transcriptional regulator, arsenate/arsenite/antimonite-responsive transcriptional repressor / arsenate reductase (thioredoxin)